MIEVVVDPVFRDLVPRQSPDEHARLEESILNEGLHEPILLWGNNIVDGHHRHGICVKHGLRFETKQINFGSRQEALEWIIKNQLGRRNLSESARAMLAVRLERNYSAASKARQAAALKQNQTVSANVPERGDATEHQDKGEARELAARDLSVSPRLVQDAKKVVSTGVPELIAAAQSGQISVSAAATLSVLKPETLRKVLSGDKKSILSLVKNLRQSKRRGQAKTQASSAVDVQTPAPTTSLTPPTNRTTFDQSLPEFRIRAFLQSEMTLWPTGTQSELRELLHRVADSFCTRPGILPPAPPTTTTVPGAGERQSHPVFRGSVGEPAEDPRVAGTHTRSSPRRKAASPQQSRQSHNGHMKERYSDQ